MGAFVPPPPEAAVEVESGGADDAGAAAIPPPVELDAAAATGEALLKIEEVVEIDVDDVSAVVVVKLFCLLDDEARADGTFPIVDAAPRPAVRSSNDPPVPSLLNAAEMCPFASSVVNS